MNNRLEELIGIIEEMVAIPTYSGTEHQETGLARYIQALFEREGISSLCVPVADGRENVLAHLPGRGAKRLLLTGHLDTVPPYDMEEALTMRRDEEHLYGRGVVDMKGQLACMIYAMIQMKRSGTVPEAEIMFAGVIDEEEKSLGTIHLLESELTADAAVVGEPTDLQICIAHRGLEWVEIDFFGKAVHGGAQHAGVSAIEMASDFIQLLRTELKSIVQREKHPLIGTSSYNLGKIEGGTQPSTVAGHARVLLDRRWVPGIRHAEVMQQFDAILRQVTEKYPGGSYALRILDASVMKEGYVHEPMDTPADAEIVQQLRRAGEAVLGEPPLVTFFPAWSDGGLLHSYAGIPSVVFGPGDLASAHAKEERIRIDALLPAVDIYRSLAEQFGK